MNRGACPRTRAFPKPVEGATNSKNDRAAEDLAHQHIQRGFPEGLKIAGLDLDNCRQACHDKTGINGQVPEREENALNHALETAAEHGEIAVIITLHVALSGA